MGRQLHLPDRNSDPDLRSDNSPDEYTSLESFIEKFERGEFPRRSEAEICMEMLARGEVVNPWVFMKALDGTENGINTKMKEIVDMWRMVNYAKRTTKEIGKTLEDIGKRLDEHEKSFSELGMKIHEFETDHNNTGKKVNETLKRVDGLIELIKSRRVDINGTISKSPAIETKLRGLEDPHEAGKCEC